MPWAIATGVVGVTGVITAGVVQVLRSNKVHSKRPECEALHDKMKLDIDEHMKLRYELEGRIIAVETARMDGITAFTRLENRITMIDSKLDTLILTIAKRRGD